MSELLTDYELKMVTDANLLLTKNKIIHKVYELLGKVAKDYKIILETNPVNIENDRGAKISRGENYRALPYVILDYPRIFGKTDVFAIRTFFWWGNFFSITLQLSGRYKVNYDVILQKLIDNHLFENWYIGCAASPWDHHFEEDNFTLIQPRHKYLVTDLPFVKIAKKIPLEKWDEVEIFLKENFTYLIQLLSSSSTNTMK